ncbi:MAG: PulJ/GspJ family protein [Acidimicrobiales bacterium]
MNRKTSPSLASSRRARARARRLSRRTSSQADQGFTLIELLIVIAITPIIVGALGIGLITIFSLQNGVGARLSDSGDAEVVAASFTKDVQSASSITTDASLATCGTGTQQMLQLQWENGEVVSYFEDFQSGTTYSLVRNDCAAGPTATPTDSTPLAYDLLAPCPIGDPVATCSDLLPPCPIGDSVATCSLFTPGEQPAPIAYDGSTVVPTSTGLVSTIGVTSLEFSIKEPNSSYVYNLSATPAEGSSTPLTNLGGPTPGSSSCGFALAGTGQFASTMCFVGFDAAELQAASTAGSTCTSTDPGQQGTDISADVPGGYLMTFCLTVTGDSVAAVSTPIGGGTCDLTKCDGGHISNGQGFLGNDNQVNGLATPFYAGIGCPASTPTLVNNVVTSSCIDPAIFQTTPAGHNTVTLSNISVTDPKGDLATGYEVITADAETIDPGYPNSYIIWSSSLPASKPLPFNLVPNFSYSDLGNACNNVPTGETTAQGFGIDDGDSTVQINGTNYTGFLTGLGTDSVECKSNWQTEAGNPPYLRTGTAMLGITPPTVNGGAEPVTISAQLQGEGYNAVAFGLLLP